MSTEVMLLCLSDAACLLSGVPVGESARGFLAPVPPAAEEGGAPLPGGLGGCQPAVCSVYCSVLLETRWGPRFCLYTHATSVLPQLLLL